MNSLIASVKEWKPFPYMPWTVFKEMRRLDREMEALRLKMPEYDALRSQYIRIGGTVYCWFGFAGLVIIIGQILF